MEGALGMMGAVGLLACGYTSSAGTSQYHELMHCSVKAPEAVARCSDEAAQEHPLPLGNTRALLVAGSLLGYAGVITYGSRQREA